MPMASNDLLLGAMNGPDEAVKDSEIIEALIKTDGMIAFAAKTLLMNRAALKARIERTPALVAALEDIKEELLDYAEFNLHASVKAGDVGSAKFVLSTIGKQRGYVTRTENTGKDGGNLPFAGEIVVNFTPSPHAAPQEEASNGSEPV